MKQDQRAWRKKAKSVFRKIKIKDEVFYVKTYRTQDLCNLLGITRVYLLELEKSGSIYPPAWKTAGGHRIYTKYEMDIYHEYIIELLEAKTKCRLKSQQLNAIKHELNKLERGIDRKKYEKDATENEFLYHKQFEKKKKKPEPEDDGFGELLEVISFNLKENKNEHYI